MARFHFLDAYVELSELASELLDGIRQQLLYYHASVYKDETAKQITDRISKLKVLVEVIGIDQLSECIRDYDAMTELALDGNSIKSCPFTTRVSLLTNSFADNLEQLNQAIFAQTASQGFSGNLQRNIRKNKGRLVSICRHGSKHWSFFRSIR